MKPKFIYLIPIILAILLLPLAGSAEAQAPSPIHAEVDRTALSTGETLMLTVTVSSSSILDAPRPNLPPLQGFDLVGTSTSSQISIVNSSITSQAVYAYRLRPYETGDLVIEPIQVTVGGQTHNTQPITIRVAQGAAAPAPAAPSASPGSGPAGAPGAGPDAVPDDLAGQDLFVEAVVDNPTPYVGQQVIYTFRFYQAINLWGQPSYEPPAFTGFWSESQADQREYRTQVGRRVYQVTELQAILFPSVVGPVTIDPARLVISGGLFSAGRTLQTRPVELDVRPLPPNAPAGFDGAVGQFTLDTTLDPTQGKVDEPLTWTVILSGWGNLNAAPDPAWPEIPGWRSFESQATINTSVQNGSMSGSRTYERLLVPTTGGTYTIPALEYVYFDPTTGQYQTLRTEPVAVSIASAPGAPGAPYTPAPASLPGKEAVEQAAADIRYLKPVPAELGPADSPLTQSALYWTAWIFPLLGAAGYLSWQQRQRYWEKNLGLARSSRARKSARKALARARRHTADAYTAVGQILTAYLSDKLDQPVAGLTHNALVELLAERGLGPDLRERVEVLLTTSELGRFAPGADSPDYARNLLQEADTLIAALEKAL